MYFFSILYIFHKISQIQQSDIYYIFGNNFLECLKFTAFGFLIQCKSVVIKFQPHSRVLLKLNVQLMCNQWRLWHIVLLLSVVFQGSGSELELQYYLYKNQSYPQDNSAIAISHTLLCTRVEQSLWGQVWKLTKIRLGAAEIQNSSK